jgi:hypothetical protein
MRKLVLLLSVVLVLVTVVSASPIPCTVSGSTSITLGQPPSSGPNFTCGTLTFDNFQVVFATGGASGQVDLIYNPPVTQPTYDSVTGEVDFSLNPNLLFGNEDIGLMFQVWGGLSGIDLAVGGTNASVSELACSVPIPTMGPSAYTCPSGSMLGSITTYTGDPTAPVFQGFSTSNPVYIFKDIGVGAGHGHLTAFTQSFHVPVPEPVSLVLLGSGLLGLGMLRRRVHKS